MFCKFFGVISIRIKQSENETTHRESVQFVTGFHVFGYLVLQVGETGHTVGVERISELVERSIDAIKSTPAGSLLEKGHLVVHGTQLRPSSLPSCLSIRSGLYIA